MILLKKGGGGRADVSLYVTSTKEFGQKCTADSCFNVVLRKLKLRLGRPQPLYCYDSHNRAESSEKSDISAPHP